MGIALIVGFVLAEDELVIAVFLSGVEMVLKGMRLPGEEDSTLFQKEKCAGTCVYNLQNPIRTNKSSDVLAAATRK